MPHAVASTRGSTYGAWGGLIQTRPVGHFPGDDRRRRRGPQNRAHGPARTSCTGVLPARSPRAGPAPFGPLLPLAPGRPLWSLVRAGRGQRRLGSPPLSRLWLRRDGLGCPACPDPRPLPHRVAPRGAPPPRGEQGGSLPFPMFGAKRVDRAGAVARYAAAAKVLKASRPSAGPGRRGGDRLVGIWAPVEEAAGADRRPSRCGWRSPRRSVGPHWRWFLAGGPSRARRAAGEWGSVATLSRASRRGGAKEPEALGRHFAGERGSVTTARGALGPPHPGTTRTPAPSSGKRGERRRGSGRRRQLSEASRRGSRPYAAGRPIRPRTPVTRPSPLAFPSVWARSPGEGQDVSAESGNRSTRAQDRACQGVGAPRA